MFAASTIGRDYSSRLGIIGLASLIIFSIAVAVLLPIQNADTMTNWSKVYNDNKGSTAVLGMAQYKSRLYATVSGGGDPQARIIRYNGGTSWTQVNTNGFGSLDNMRASSIVSDSSYLYVGTYNGYLGAEVWRYDGSSWTQINTGGFGEGSTIDECSNLVIHDSHLYATGNAVKFRVYRYDGGTSWTRVSTPEPWDSNNFYVHSAISWNGYLWVGTENTDTGTEVWKYNGATWSKANVDGFGHANHYYTYDFAVYKNALYAVGSLGDVMRQESGTSWSDINAQFTDYVMSAVTYNGKLYVGTWPSSGGCRVWSYNGSSWTKENSNGFGDAKNIDANAMAVFNNQLYVGTIYFALDGTAQIWRSGGTAPSPPKKKAVYLAEGTTDYGFSTYISIQNPNSSTVPATITYMTNTGAVSGGTTNLPANSQTTVNPRDILGNKDFSTKVEYPETTPIAVDRTMTWNAGAGEEAHNSVGVPAPAKTWYLPEGSSDWGFECYLLIQNPNSKAANCNITYMIENEQPKTVPVSVPGNSRATYNMADHIGAKDASIKVEANVPVIPNGLCTVITEEKDTIP